ncbi:MAG TPA: hypothetical protein PKL37_02205 [Panacibacter sp.]|mgnify:CR=1 FL=1|nr:hypothetical protein [Panacibacter sp.]
MKQVQEKIEDIFDTSFLFITHRWLCHSLVRSEPKSPVRGFIASALKNQWKQSINPYHASTAETAAAVQECDARNDAK